ncbi:MAG: hypothetical protein JNK12_24780 [Acidimicrobiales bacterium]|nr:hypothetical protein [Acidimicrobiales bacterium]
MSRDDLIERRMALLGGLYDAVDGDRLQEVSWDRLGSQIGMDAKEADRTARWLIDRDLAGMMSMGASMHITPAGMDAVEEWRAHAANDEDLTAPHGAVLTTEETRVVEPLIRALQMLVEQERERLGQSLANDLEAQAATLNAQMHSPSPRRSVVAAVVGSIKWAADGAGQTVMGAVAMAAIETAWGLLH